MAVLSLPLFRLGWLPACLTHVPPKLWTEYQGLCPAHPCSFVSLPVPAWGMFEPGDKWGYSPLSLAQFRVFYNFSYLHWVVYKGRGRTYLNGCASKKYIIFGLFCSPMQFNARGEHMAQRGCFPLYNSHTLYHMWGIISCYGMYNLSHVYSSIRQDGQCTVCFSAPETLSLW